MKNTSRNQSLEMRAAEDKDKIKLKRICLYRNDLLVLEIDEQLFAICTTNRYSRLSDDE
jgi:hypothetical protein